MTALPGAGAFGPEADDPEPEPEPEPDPEPDAPLLEEDEELELLLVFSSLSCCANGSLLANRLNEASWPSWTDGAGDAVSEPPAVVLGDASPPASVGAASVGVPVGVVVVGDATGGGVEGCSFFSTRGT